MNDAMLGYEDRVLSAGICRSMSTAKRSYATLDVRTVLAQGLPSPQRMPVLILSATGLRNYAWLKVGDLNAKLQTYLDAGGRVLWIGGDAKPPARPRTHRHSINPDRKTTRCHSRQTSSANGIWPW